MNPDLLTPIGTIGWFAMLVIGPLLSGRYRELLLPVFLGMLIIGSSRVLMGKKLSKMRDSAPSL